MQTMKIVDKWLKDLPQQFQGKKRIEILISAFARQMEEVRKVFDDVNQLTDIDTAHGVNLDYVGDIVVLSRKDAQVILRSKMDQELGDEIYRQVLRYKAVKNTCDCTYEDIVSTMKLLWDVDYIRYIEKPERPAAIFMQMPPFDINTSDPVAKRILAIRPAGVGLVYAVSYCLEADHSGLEKIILINMRMCWALPFWGCYVFDGAWKFDGSILLNQQRRYNLILGLKYYQGAFYELAAAHTHLFDGTWNFDGSILLDNIRRIGMLKTHMKISGPETSCRAAVAASHRADFWQLLSGSLQSPDSGEQDGCIRRRMDASARIYLEACGPAEKIRDGPVEISRNLWRFDGAELLDGSRKFNAMQRLEVL